ncbi:hypothetical protein E1162_19270 [Rhodobacteraceae bacterium RKSG542]|uniref:hypothetical protein n=1 Tax=Pseudovibrio flavus TaxID=2529854 RepID=UPI0012BC5595|nr:hypothetical protein [Pseudovibrio flavus]MTI19388.1 hypothetical protein [Pseudovibrio flavus]
MSHQNSVLWLDQQEAHIFTNIRGEEEVKSSGVYKEWDYKAVRLHEKHPNPEFREHEKGGKNFGRFSPDEHKFYEEIEGHLKGSHRVLVMGPGFAKSEFAKHALKHVPGFDEVLVGIETVDHPSEKQLIEFTRVAFGAGSDAALERLKELARKHSKSH